MCVAVCDVSAHDYIHSEKYKPSLTTMSPEPLGMAKRKKRKQI